MANTTGYYYYTKDEMDATFSSWRLIGEATLSSASNALEAVLTETAPLGIMIKVEGAMNSGSATWIDLRAMNGSTILTTDALRISADGSSIYTAWANAAAFIGAVDTAYQYDSFIFEAFSRRNLASEWRTWQVDCGRIGNGGQKRQFISRQQNNTEPTAIRLQTGGTFTALTHIEVWGRD